MTSLPALSRPGAALRDLAASLAARAHGHDGLLAAPLPRELLDAVVAAGLPALRRRAIASWETGAGEEKLFGLGETLRLQGAREETPADAHAALTAAGRSVDGALDGAGRPRFFGGFRFDPENPANDPHWEPFGGWQFVMPTVVLEFANGEWAGSIAVAANSDEDELVTLLQRALFTEPQPPQVKLARTTTGLDPEAWKAAVAATVDRIARQEVDKVVLARPVLIETSRSRAEALGVLAEHYPTTYVFSFTTPGGTWLGATPERLVSLVDGVAYVASLAGSRPRGADDDEDAALGRELLESAKERAEHAFVVEAVREALEPVCANLDIPTEPELMRVANIQHLYTPVTGVVRDGVDVLHLVERIHPTPAVGAWPRDPGLAVLRELEQMDRGWYAAPIGWVDLDGEGEFGVALRSALLGSGSAVLYAGAGIVAGSNPEDELAETELKLRPLRGALEDR